MKDGFLFDHIPVVRLFPRHIRYLQTVIRCDTATWRFLEIARIGQFKSSRPESPENRLQTHDDFVKVLRCMGRAEAYYHYPGVRDQNYFGNDEIFIDGKRWNLAEYIAERDTIELPVLFARVENPEYSKTNRDAQGREEQHTVPRYIWKSLINDTTLPSPREATIKRWIDGGKQGPNPCPCWNEEDDAEVQILVPVPDDGKKTDVNP